MKKEIEIPGSIKNKKAVIDWLKKANYTIGQSTFYRDCREGKFAKGRPGGPYSRKEIKDYLKILEAGGYAPRTQSPAAASGVHERKTAAEADLREVQAKEKQFKFDALRGKLIERERMELEVATRGVALDAALTHMIHSSAIELITLVGGNTGRAPKLIDLQIRKKDKALTEFARVDSWRVLIELDEEE